MKQLIEGWLRKRFVKMHGEGAAHQADIYRCASCGKLVTWKKIRNADLCCQGHLNPTNPTMLEKFRLIAFP
jgi:hypothetical protein